MAIPNIPLSDPVVVGQTGHDVLHTDVNQAVNYIAAGGAGTANLFLATPSGAPGAADFRAITAADIAAALSGGSTGSIVIAAPGTLTVSSDTDVLTILGRAKIDSRTTDVAFFSHFDMTGVNDYAVRQTAAGLTRVNAITGQTVTIAVANAIVVTVAATSVTLAQPLTVQSDTDATTILGRARIDSRTTDQATFSHFDMTGATQYAIRQQSNGTTDINTASGQLVAIRVNGTSVINVSSTIVGIVQDLQITTAGRGLYVKEGSNATMGVATLIGGTLVVSTTKVTATSRIFLTHETSGGTPGFVIVSARTAGVSFTILSSNGADTSDIGWIIVEPAP